MTQTALPTILPPEFADLSPWTDWAQTTPDARQDHRRNATRQELKAFYDAMMPRLQDILTAVDAFPLGALPDGLHPLYNMALALAEIAPHIELYGGTPAVPFAFDESRFVAVHGRQDTALGLAPSAAA